MCVQPSVFESNDNEYWIEQQQQTKQYKCIEHDAYLKAWV